MATVPHLGAYLIGLLVGTRRFTLSGVDDAVQLLEQHWPNKTGIHYGRALRSCRLALLRNGPAAVAREDLIAACLEAGIPHQFQSGSDKEQLPLFAGPEDDEHPSSGAARQ